MPVPSGSVTLGYRFQKTGRLQGNGTLTINGTAVGSCRLDRTLERISLEPLRIGRSGLSPVSPEYRGSFPFTGTLHRVTYLLGEDREGRTEIPFND